jgi:uncharacterized membrane protein
MMSFFGSSWWVVLMWVAMVLFWGLVVWAVILLAGGATAHREEDHNRSDPRQILDQRLARAEIEDDEYSRLRLLVDDRSPGGSGGGR